MKNQSWFVVLNQLLLPIRTLKVPNNSNGLQSILSQYSTTHLKCQMRHNAYRALLILSDRLDPSFS